MNKIEYEQLKADIIRRLGKPEYDGQQGASNESARQLLDLKGKYLADLRFERANKLKSTLDNSRIKKSKELRLHAIDLSENDLASFTEKEQDVLIGWFEDKQLSPKQLANRFGTSYQFVNSLLRDKRTLLLDAKYFQKVLTDNTKMALLKLTQDSDPKIVLAASEYLKLMADKQDDNGGSLINDPIAEKVLEIVGDWLAGDQEKPLVLTREGLQGCADTK